MAAVEKAPKAAPAPKVTKPKVSNVIVFRRTAKAMKEDSKVGPQVKAILTTLESFGSGRDVTRKELLGKLTPDVLKTRQDPARILSFYQNKMVEDGWLTKKIVASEKVAA